MTEFELKFEIPSANLKGVTAALTEGKLIRRRFQASYFDTADGALAADGIEVRLRKEGRRWVQTAKRRTADLLARLEHSIDLPLHSAGDMPTLDLSRHRGGPIGKLIDKALGLKRNQSYPKLELLYSTDVQRITKSTTSGVSVLEVTLDHGRIFCDAKSRPICELEVELKRGVPLDAVKLARQMCAAHGLWVSTISKSIKGQRLCSLRPFKTALSAASLSFPRHASGQDMITAVVKDCLHQILPNMSELADSSKNAEHIHQLRVGIRKLRTALRELGKFAHAHAHAHAHALNPVWEAALVKVFRILGTCRDHSHLALVLQPQWLAAGGPAIDSDAAADKLPDVGLAVRAPEFQDALLGLLCFVHTGAPKELGRSGALKKEISADLDKLHRNALRHGKKFSASSQTQQHDVRKLFKRLRYSIEFASPLFATRKVHALTAALKPVQDALGLYNDELMALQTLGVLAADDPRAWFGVGWLTARIEGNVKGCVKEIKNFASVQPFW